MNTLAKAAGAALGLAAVAVTFIIAAGYGFLSSVVPQDYEVEEW